MRGAGIRGDELSPAKPFAGDGIGSWNEGAEVGAFDKNPFGLGIGEMAA